MRWTAWVLTVAALGLLLPVHARAQEPHVVSACDYPGPFMVGVALPDTVAVDSATAPDAEVPPERRPLGGQKFLVQRSNFRLPSDTVILAEIPLLYGTDGPPPPGPPHPARWLRPDAQYLAQGSLRGADHWSEGVPTFDIASAYPHRPVVGPDPPPRPTQTGDPAATPDELFDFCSMDVDLDRVERGDPADLEPIAWARQSGDAWRKQPIQRNLRDWAGRAVKARAVHSTPDVAGTWAVTITLPTERKVTFFIRTSDRIHDEWDRTYVDRQSGPPPWALKSDGYELAFWLARTVEKLPHAQGAPSDLRCPQFMQPRFDPSQPREPVDHSCLWASTPWGVDFPAPTGVPRLGSWPSYMIEWILGDDVEVRGLMQEREWDHRDLALTFAGWNRLGRFFDEPGESLRFAQAIPINAEDLLRLEAVRISSETVKDSFHQPRR